MTTTYHLYGCVMTRLIGTGWSLVVRLGSALAAIAAVFSLAQRWYQVARMAAASWVSLTLWGWVIALFAMQMIWAVGSCPRSHAG